MTDEDAFDLEALKTVEKVLWRNGITGDACTRVAASVLKALEDAGYRLDRR